MPCRGIARGLTEGVQLEEDVGVGELECLGRIGRVAAQRGLVGAAVQQLHHCRWWRHVVTLVCAQRLQHIPTSASAFCLLHIQRMYCLQQSL